MQQACGTVDIWEGGGPLLPSLVDLLGYPIPNPNPNSIDHQKGRRALCGVLVRVRARVNASA